LRQLLLWLTIPPLLAIQIATCRNVKVRAPWHNIGEIQELTRTHVPGELAKVTVFVPFREITANAR
jgi:hypothetical protein